MTSVLRSHAQIPVRNRYFTVIDDISGYTATTTTGGVLITPTQFLNNYNATVNVASGALLKDLGRSITIYSPTTNLHTEVYRWVQRVNGANTEGVGGAYNTFYINTWSADGTGVGVARTG
jgi:hypothetical protein